LQLAGYPTASAKAVTVVDTSPTASPSSSPEVAHYADKLSPKNRDITIGVIIGLGVPLIALVAFAIYYFFCKKKVMKDDDSFGVAPSL
jgi:hypothetical protein